jgi:glutamate-1-semialdehyde 2,1-aminomutase
LGYKRSQSVAAFAKAQEVIPGGVNSPARAFGAVGGVPPFISHGQGPYLYDIDGNKYVDYVCSWGPLIFGHVHPRVKTALIQACEAGSSFGAPTQVEIAMAQKIVSMVPSIEMVRMVNSGTEATMSAIRLARGYTGRDKIIKFEGGWHGHGDSFLIKAGSSALTLGTPDSPGVPEGVAQDTITAPYNNLEAVKAAVKENKDVIAAIIVEPVAGNMGTILPRAGFLEGLRKIANENGIILIFDEVITGFRLGPGGAQECFNVLPDMTCLGKIIGGGLPVGAYGGRKEIMQEVSPLGMKVSQAGTLSGNPLAMSAGLEQLNMLTEPGVYEQLEQVACHLEEGIQENLKRLGLKYSFNRIGAMMCLFFTSAQVVDYTSAITADTERFKRFYWKCLENGVYFPPSQFECLLPSVVHSNEDIEKTLAVHYAALKAVH